MAGTQKLDDLTKLVNAIRAWHYQQTLPWSDGGSRLLPMANFFDYKAILSDYQTQFDEAVSEFIAEYPTLVSASAFQLGELFDANDYPDASELGSKFKFKYVFLPVPDVGDFRVDVGEAYKADLKEQYESFYQAKLNDAMADAWARLHECLSNMSDRLTSLPTPRVLKDGTEVFTPVFRDSLVGNAVELCELLSKLNVTNDPKLESCRKKLEVALTGVSAGELREDDDLRLDAKSKVDEILSMF